MYETIIKRFPISERRMKATKDGLFEDENKKCKTPIYETTYGGCDHPNFKGKEIIGRKQTGGLNPINGQYMDPVESLMLILRGKDGIEFHWGDKVIQVPLDDLKDGKDIPAPCNKEGLEGHGNHWLITFHA